MSQTVLIGKAIVRALYGYDRLRLMVHPGDAPGAIQSAKAECDISRIMSKYQRTGVVDWQAKHAGEYGETSPFDLMEALETVEKAREMFHDLPSSLRDRFRNDPVAFMEFCHDSANLEEARELGLLTVREPPVTVAPAEVPAAVPPTGS